MVNKETIEIWFKELQDSICQELERIDGKAKFREDLWERGEGGGGRTRVIQGGNVFEKGGVNFSAVWGPTPEAITKALQVPPSDFYATGVSIVIHTQNPWCPIIHMNTRYFEMSSGIWWFGGGIDMTPHYINPKEAKLFHSYLKNCCDKFDVALYPKYKKWADDYFFIKHRNETRGIGGIFFDRLGDKEPLTKEQLFEFVKEVGRTFIPAYEACLRDNVSKPFTESNKNWQFVRRGRYAEFNLVYDKGTKFGLDTNGRIESILMSLPPQASWVYDHQVIDGSEEDFTQQHLSKNENWLEWKS